MFFGVYEMKYLLDTHTLLWYLLDDKSLSATARRTVDTEECFYSKVSLWEIAIKQSIGKLRYKHSIPKIKDLCDQENFLNLTVTEEHIERIKTLPFIHGDPFDRILVAQAQSEDFTIITRDKFIPQYDVKTLW